MDNIFIHEVGPRDGLQGESLVVPLPERLHWITTLLESGTDILQLGSFVNPQKVPQMADTEALFAHFGAPGRNPKGSLLSALVLNEKGLERSLACDVGLICMGVSASTTHSLKNTGMTPAEALPRILAMAKKAMADGRRVQTSVQSAFGCGYEGPIAVATVIEFVRQYLDAGVEIISLADTAGHAQPEQVEDLFGSIRQLDAGVTLACHFHNTYGLGLANCMAALNSGVTYIESASGGLGGCPFTRVAAGNVSTEDLVHSLQRMGLRMDIDLGALLRAGHQAEEFLGRQLPSLVLHSGSIVGFAGLASAGAA